jgi:hypothetical protein
MDEGEGEGKGKVRDQRAIVSISHTRYQTSEAHVQIVFSCW